MKTLGQISSLFEILKEDLLRFWSDLQVSKRDCKLRWTPTELLRALSLSFKSFSQICRNMISKECLAKNKRMAKLANCIAVIHLPIVRESADVTEVKLRSNDDSDPPSLANCLIAFRSPLFGINSLLDWISCCFCSSSILCSQYFFVCSLFSMIELVSTTGLSVWRRENGT